MEIISNWLCLNIVSDLLKIWYREDLMINNFQPEIKYSLRSHNRQKEEDSNNEEEIKPRGKIKNNKSKKKVIIKKVTKRIPRRMYVCPNLGCNKNFNKKIRLSHHFKICGSYYAFKCPYCEYKAKTRKGVQAHQLHEHNNRKNPYVIELSSQ